jgi:hypothetical protein
MTRRKLIRSLNEAARAMPPSERQKFRQFLRGAEALPDDGLPAITRGLNRRPLARLAKLTGPAQLSLFRH